MTGDKKQPKHQPPLYLDMPFEEALEWLSRLHPDELPDRQKRKRKPPDDSKPPDGKGLSKGEPPLSRNRKRSDG